MESFSDRLRKARIAAGMTQEQLGFALEITKSSVSAWENGREMPSFKFLPELSHALGCSLDVLICGIDFQYESSASLSKNNALVARDAQEASLLTTFRKLSVKKRKALLELLHV